MRFDIYDGPHMRLMTIQWWVSQLTMSVHLTRPYNMNLLIQIISTCSILANICPGDYIVHVFLCYPLYIDNYNMANLISLSENGQSSNSGRKSRDISIQFTLAVLGL